MKAIVTGGNGFIGSRLVDKLISLGFQVIVIDDLSAKCNEKFYFNNKAINHKVNILDYDKIFPLFKDVDYVFHLAAESRIESAIQNPCYTTRVNVEGTCNVLQAAREHNVKKVIYSSTSSVYGLTEKVPISEGEKIDCLNPYSATKFAGEEMCRIYNKLYGLKTVIFRYFNVYGEGAPTKGHYAPVVGLFLKMAANKEPLKIVGNGSQKRDFVHVQDIVDINIKVALSENNDIGGEVFNIGCGKNVSILDLAKKISNNHLFMPHRKGEAQQTLANITKVKKYFDWTPKIDLDTWIQQNLRKYK